MDIREQINKYSLDVNGLLNESIAINNKILGAGGSFLSLFKKIDFQLLFDETAEVLSSLEIKKQEIDAFYGEMNHETNIIYEKYLLCLTEYLSALIDSIGLLKRNVGLLLDKSKGLGKLSLWQHMKASKEVNNSIQKYHLKGQILQGEYEKLYSNN